MILKKKKHYLNPERFKGCGAGCQSNEKGKKTERRKISGFICPRQSVEKHQSIRLV